MTKQCKFYTENGNFDKYGYCILIYTCIAMFEKSTKTPVSTAFCESSFTSVEKWKMLLNILIDEFD